MIRPWWRSTHHWRLAARLAAVTLSLGVLVALGAFWATDARADTVSGCQVDRGLWLFKGTARSICDGEFRPDGSWLRAREFFTPAHYVPLPSYCSGGRYYSSCSTSGGYWQDRTSSGVETYVVFDYNVLPDEPGHLVGGA